MKEYMDLIIVVVIIVLAVILAIGLKVAIFYAAKKGFDFWKKDKNK